MELIIAGGVVLGFSIFVVFTLRILFESEMEELRNKDKRYYYRKYVHYQKKANKAYKKYQSLKRDGGDNIKSRKR